MIHIWTLIVVNLILIGSYFYTGLSTTDFGKTPKYLHGYMLVSALVAYALNLVYVLRFQDASAFQELAIYVASYYLLQLLFIPLVRQRKRNAVRLLLLICTFPIAAMVSLAKLQRKDVLISTFVLAHVFVNDFLLYSFLF